MKTKLTILTALLVLLSAACSQREELAIRLAEERRASEARTPASPSEFLAAAASGDLPTVLAALEKQIDVNVEDEGGRTALQLASFDGHREVVLLLLAREAEVDHLDAQGRTALMFASTGPNIETVDLLLEAGADVDAIDLDEHFTSLMFAAAEGQLEIVQALLRAGANPNVRDVDGDSALEFAAQRRHAEVVSLLESVMQ